MFNAFLDAAKILQMASKKSAASANSNNKRRRHSSPLIILSDLSTASSIGNKRRKSIPPLVQPQEEMIGSLTLTERRLKVQAYLVKRTRMLKNRQSKHKYNGRTKFANARRRVKGRFVTLEFMQVRGIKFDSEKPGWVCSTLSNKVFLTSDEAVKAVDAANGNTTGGGIPPPPTTRKGPPTTSSSSNGSNGTSSSSGGEFFETPTVEPQKGSTTTSSSIATKK